MPVKKKPVSLGGRAKDRTPLGHDDATPERLAQARRQGSSDVDGQGVRRIGDAFDALHARGFLDRQDAAANARLWQAGDRLRRHWHASRLDGLSAFDFTRDSVDTSYGDRTAPSEAALRHRDAVRAAMATVSGRLWPYVCGAVIDAQPLAELRRLVTDTGHARTAEALALERIREGLHRLCELWTMNPKPRTGRIAAWRDDEPAPAGAG